MKLQIKFDSDGLVLAGDLYTPSGYDATQKYPAILVSGSWTTVKEQMSGLYARELAEHGFVTLAIDARYFGESEGQPRFWENPKAKISDLKNAITFLRSVAGVSVDRLFMTAICASSGYMACIAAADDRIKGWATVASWLHDGEAVKMVYGGEEGVQARIRQAQDAKRVYAETRKVEYVPTVSMTDIRAAMTGNFDYYLNPRRGAVPAWSADKFAVMSWEDWLTFDPMPMAARIKAPTLMIHSDEAALPDNTKRFFSEIPGIPGQNKELHWTKGSQFDFYDQPQQVTEAVNAITEFFKKLI